MDLSDELLRALSHHERRRLLVLCRDKAMPAGELAADAGMAGPSVSEHLKVLRKTGLAKVEKQGKYWLYKTDTDLLIHIVEALADELLGQRNHDKEN